ncbi:hypothetical protein HYALB_00009021 [Hymenoscyphus albidus]|uniref:Uncharacterized protein n=1 Tax=Hymenoscyphus albidus TaxID=595503 RepID=A0A9N9M4D4_9HELO|nr:hypothetical protein HYALB_00009021 [Hymenoscyphus albidus]
MDTYLLPGRLCTIQIRYLQGNNHWRTILHRALDCGVLQECTEGRAGLSETFDCIPNIAPDRSPTESRGVHYPCSNIKLPKRPKYYGAKNTECTRSILRMTSPQNNHILQGAAAVLAIAAIVIYTKETLSRDPAPTLGPAIIAGYADKFCGINDIQVSRLPLKKNGTSSWSTIMSVIHLSPSLKHSSKVQPVSLKPLILHEGKLCVQISRATLMSLFAPTNARPVFSYSSAAGYLSAYPSYGGQWRISWPIGKPCIVSLAPHDSHKVETDIYPASFPVRVDKCIETLCGIISDGKSWKLAFPGRAKGTGPYILQERKKGFPGAHGSRHLYNMMGGKVFEVDLLVLLPSNAKQDGRKLEVPCLDPDNKLATVYLSANLEELLARALDCLPWSQLSWSMHRGLRDILLAYGTPVMDHYRVKLGAMLKDISKFESILVTMGWEVNFVHDSMGEMAQSSIISGGGNSGDLVRVVVAIVEAWLETSEGFVVDKDETFFWRRRESMGEVETELSPELVVALTKFFVLEWSQELDYQLYHQLPTEIFVG